MMTFFSLSLYLIVLKVLIRKGKLGAKSCSRYKMVENIYQYYLFSAEKNLREAHPHDGLLELWH